jgi:hypothetical protein
VRAVPIAFAALLACAPAARSNDDAAICETVARAVLAIDPPDDWRGPWQSPIRALAKASGGSVGIDADTWRSDRAQALDKLSREYLAQPSLLKAIAELTDDRWLFSVHRFGISSLHMAKVVEGSASCERFVFFDAPAGGPALLVAAPPVVTTAEPSAFCYRSKAYAGEVTGVPAFVVETDYDSTVELSFTPWRDGRWQQECQALVHFTDVFDVTDRFCRDADCEDMASYALPLVKNLDRQPESTRVAARSQNETFKAMKALAHADPQALQRLPTFGAEPSRYEFAPDSVDLPLTVGGMTYLVRVGHAAIGWRIYPDYLFAAYRLAAHALEPVAGLYVSKTRGKPVRATVD